MKKISSSSSHINCKFFENNHQNIVKKFQCFIEIWKFKKILDKKQDTQYYRVDKNLISLTCTNKIYIFF